VDNPGPQNGEPVPRAAAQDDEVLRRRVSAAVRRACPGWLGHQAEDIVQNVLIKLLKSSRKSEGTKTFSPVYLEKSVYGAVVDEIRRACRRREKGGEDETIDQVTSRDAGPDRRTFSSEIARGILDCLARLSRPRRLAVTLYLQGCTVPETAQHLQWVPKRAENYVYRGLSDLRQCLQGKGLEP
jgi:RNA polymerase sigma-70 factor (ECF subfamily)